MASDDSSGGRPAAPIVIRIKLRYDDVEAMVQRFAANVGKSGLFLPTKALQPVGAEVKFELRLADDTPALVGLGRVKAATPPDPEHPRAAFGMAIELMRVTPQSRALILRMLERRRAMGLTEVALPMAADIEAARRAELTTGPVPLVPVPAVPLVPAPPVPSAPAALPVTPLVPSAPQGEGLMTAPRRTTGQMAVAKAPAISPLAPEGPRRRRASISELMAAAAPQGLALPELDEDIDLEAALARARVLAGGDLDAELEALAAGTVPPIEVSIEAASAELVRALGGRERGERWAPPPAVAEAVAPAEAGEPVAGAAAPVEAGEPVAEAAAPVEAGEPAPVEVAAEAAEVPAAPIEVAAEAAEVPAAPIEVAAEAAEAPAAPIEVAAEAAEVPAAVEALDPAAVDAAPVEPDQLAEIIHQLNELDLEDVEHTEMGAMPGPPEPAAAEPEPAAAPAGNALAELTASLDAQLAADEAAEAAEAEAEAEADADALGLPSALGISVEGPSQLRYIEPELPVPDDDAGSAPHDLSLDEFDDFEILAEADAADEDLLTASAERETSNLRVPAAPASQLDFAARLDFDDDEDEDDEDVFDLPHAARTDVFDGGHADPLLASAGQALAAFETGDESIDEALDRRNRGDALPRIIDPIYDSEQSNSYTFAGIPSDDSLDLDFGPAIRDRAAPRPTKLPPPSRAAPAAPGDDELPSLYASPVEDAELEHALGALDVDLDDLALAKASPSPRAVRPAPQASPAPRAARPAPQASPAPAQPAPRAPVRTSPHVIPARPRPTPVSTPTPRITSDDGLEIDFGDDD